MDKTMIEMLINQGIFAILFIWLFVETRKENRLREEQYQKLIQQLIIKLNLLDDLAYILKDKIKEEVQ